MTIKHHDIPWLVLGGGLLYFFYSVSGILLPFVVGIFVAYLLSPAVNSLEKRGVPRILTTLVMVLGFFVGIGALFFVAFPFLKTELIVLAHAVPQYWEKTLNSITPWMDTLSGYIDTTDIDNLKTNASTYIGNMITWGLTFIANIFTNTLALANIISLVILTPLITFYMLRDWSQVMGTLRSLIPQSYASPVTTLTRDVNTILGNYIRGQSLVCLTLVFLYSLGLWLVGLKYAVTIGCLTGFLSFIPYFGPLVGLIASLGMAFSQFAEWAHIGMVALVFASVMMVDGYFLTPKFVGDSVGLHPVWIIFALLAGGKLFGFLGIVLALPTAAALGVIIRFIVHRYYKSTFYKGDAHEKDIASPLKKQKRISHAARTRL